MGRLPLHVCRGVLRSVPAARLVGSKLERESPVRRNLISAAAPLCLLLSGCGPAGELDADRDVTIDEEDLQVDSTSDPAGSAETFSPKRIDQSTNNPFFQSFGTNGRTCGTCHVERLGWSITPGFAANLDRRDPLFVFDGSDCLPAGAPNPNPGRNSIQLRRYANIRIDLPIPAGADYTLVSSRDPLNCPTPPSAADLRMYRRPLPTANSAFLATVMWDGRENVAETISDDLKHQSNDATLGHAQAKSPLSDQNQTAIVVFETNT